MSENYYTPYVVQAMKFDGSVDSAMAISKFLEKPFKLIYSKAGLITGIEFENFIIKTNGYFVWRDGKSRSSDFMVFGGKEFNRYFMACTLSHGLIKENHLMTCIGCEVGDASRGALDEYEDKND
jgi:hypothetical protein